jgi:hypothetical protein
VYGGYTEDSGEDRFSKDAWQGYFLLFRRPRVRANRRW